MAKVKIQGHASGTGVLTVTAPNTSTDRTITLPDATGTLLNSDGDGSNLTGIASSPFTEVNTHKFTYTTDTNPVLQVIDSTNTVKAQMQSGNSSAVFGSASDHSVAFIQGAAETTRAVIETSGDITVSTGDIVFGTAGKGIVLGSTSNTDANTLDDYETGTFTPNVGGDATYTNQNGSYTKVGRLVTVKINFQVNAINSSGKNIIYGLPFTSTSGAAHVGSVGYYSGLSVSPTWIGCYGDANNTQITFIWNTGNSSTIGANGQNLFQNSARIDLFLTYQTT